MSRRKFDKIQYIILFASPILSLVAFIITYYIDPLDYSENSS